MAAEMIVESGSSMVNFGMELVADHTSVVSLNLFVALLCGCIVIGHLLEENRWINESIIALVIVSLSCSDSSLTKYSCEIQSRIEVC